ncbi:MAG: arginine deiminase-related protein [Luteimonas sp.]
MITRDAGAFAAFARDCVPDFGAGTAKAAFLVAPDGFARAEQSAGDNRYMADAGAFDAASAAREHRDLHVALSQTLPTVCFAGDRATPDAVFPNNVFATVPGRLIVGRMRHEVRRREAERGDIRAFFEDAMGYAVTDLSIQPHPCELTGALAIDRARGLGFCGLSERCDEVGARSMHEAFGLRATLLFDLAPGEYHTNVVLAVLAGRTALACPAGFAESGIVLHALAGVYGAQAIALSPREHAAFAGNAIALSDGLIWMSQAAAASLRPATRALLETGGWEVRGVPLDAVEAAGGSLRCCVGEIF